MMVRVELYCHGWPDGNIPHGYVNVKVKGEALDHEEEMAKEVLLSQVSRDCYMHEDGVGSCYANAYLMNYNHNDEFDKGEVYAEVVNGEGEALSQNPIGKQFSEF